MKAIIDEDIPCYSGSCSEIYLEKAFKDAGLCPSERLPVAKRLGETSLMFPVHPTLTDDDMANICRVVKMVFSYAER